MSKRIVWENGDGTVAITVSCEEPQEGETEDQMLDRIAAKLQADVPDQFGSLTPAKVDVSDIPASRRFRASWRKSGSVVATNVTVAKAQLKADVRVDRNARLLASDKEHLRRQEIGNQSQKNDYATFRQALRDLPATSDAAIDALTTEAALIAYAPTWPTEPS